jgi:hypothetical protein
LVAGQVAHGDATQTFVRVHTEYLKKEASALEGRLSRARVVPSLAGRRRRAVGVATRVEQDLERLHRHPGDRGLGARIRIELELAAKQAERLAG